MKLSEITPQEFMCHIPGKCCPAVFETDNGSYVIIGKKLSAVAASAVGGRVGADEYVIEIPKGMIAGLK